MVSFNGLRKVNIQLKTKLSRNLRVYGFSLYLGHAYLLTNTHHAIVRNMTIQDNYFHLHNERRVEHEKHD